MAPLLDSASRQAQQVGFVRIMAVAVITFAIVIAMGIAFGWTLPAAPSFEITPDPVGDLPF